MDVGDTELCSGEGKTHSSSVWHPTRMNLVYSSVTKQENEAQTLLWHAVDKMTCIGLQPDEIYDEPAKVHHFTEEMEKEWRSHEHNKYR